MEKLKRFTHKLKSTQGIYFAILLFIVIIVVVINFSYALFSTKTEKSGTLNIIAGDFAYSLASSELTNNQITVLSLQEKVFEVTITNTNDRDTSYEMYYKLISPSNLPTGVQIGYANTTKDPVQGTEIKKNSTKKIQIVVRNQSSEGIILEFGVQGGFIGKELTLEKGSSLDKKILLTGDDSGAPAPELEDNMIPVTYDETNKTWVKADRSNPAENPWYAYQNQMWANAVVVKETGTMTRTEYLNSAVGTPISMDDILQMLVWVPRYKYTIGTETTPMNIVFEDKTKIKSTGNATGNSYLTHPAFTFGTTELNGIWFAKFEPSADITCTAAHASIGTGCDQSSMRPVVKPNRLIWTGARVSTYFQVAQNMKSAGNIYGYNTNGVNTRMARNDEWGAAAYLTHSIYGRCTENSCEEVTINNINTGDYRSITGCAGDTVSAGEVKSTTCPVTNQYNTDKGVKASTTGNIYGIYDLVGGDREYLMGNYNKISGVAAIYNSGFSGSNIDGSTTNGISWPESKYLNIFTMQDVATACNGKVCYGQALSETLGWNGDYYSFEGKSYPWLLRSGRASYGTRAGLFTFELGGGHADVGDSFRLVVTKE